MPRPGAARAPTLLIVTFAAVLVGARPGLAAGGDIFAKGNRWCASTHPNHGTLDGYGPALDLGSPQDGGWPVYAPGKGRVRIHSEGWGSGWGNSIIWISADGKERIHLAHLASFGATGTVVAGDRIGRVGSTGRATSPHVHSSARRDGEPARLILGWRRIEAGRCYVSRGPIPPTCLGREATLVGTRGDDVLVGTSGNDVIVARAGDDRVEGRGGNDRICAGRGHDVILGGKGADRLLGGRGADHISGGGAADVLDGGEGVDLLDGGAGIDRATYARAAGPVTLHLGEGTASGQGEDTLVEVEDVVGSPLGDAITGDAGPNRLYGLGGDDVLDGGEGKDLVDGGDGFDRCTAETVSNCEEPVAEPAPTPSGDSAP
ncbi:MAG: peptidoglycan DD-metalloendopeptidase family protein [Actinomycetota bacterium]